MKRALIFVLVGLLLLSAPAVYAKGASGGARGGSFSGSRSTTTTGRTTTSTTSKSTTTNTAPKAPTIGTAPSTSTKTTTTTTPKTVAGKTYSKTGYVVDSTYQPRFRGGQTYPAGSTVYYQGGSMWDWFPIYYLLTHDSHRDAVVTTPDGKEQAVEEEGVDTMYVVNWIFAILLAVGLIGLIVWLVNKKTRKEENYAY